MAVTGTTTVGNGTSGTLSFSSATNPGKTFTGLVTISAGATWTESAAITPTFSGGITNSGTFTASTGVHTFSTNSQALTGTFTIPSVTVTTIVLTNNGTLTVNTALAGTGTLSNSSSGTLNVGGTCSVTTVTNNGIVNSSGAGTITSTTVTNNLTWNMSGTGTVTAFTNSATGVLYISATPTVPTITTLTVSAVGNTVNYNGLGAQTVKVAAYSNLTLSGSGAKTFAVTTVNNNLTLSGSATATTGANLTIGGALSVGDGTTLTIGAFTLAVTGTTTVGNGTSGTLSFSSATNPGKTFTGLVTISAGATWTESAAITPTFSGGITNSGTFTASTGVHTFSTNSQALTGTFTIPSVTVTTIVLTNNGTLTVNTALAGTGTLSNSSSGTLNVGGTCSVTTVTNNGIVNSSGAGTITSTTVTNNLTWNMSGTGTVTAFTNSATGVLNISSATVPTFTTLTVSAAGNTVNYNGLGAQTVKVAAYSNLTLSGSGAKTFAVTTVNNNLTLSGSATATTGANLTIGGALSVGDGTTLTIGAFTLAVTGTTTVGNGTSGTLSFSSATNPGKTFTGLVTISAGATWTESAAITPTFSGGITNSGTFTASTGVHTFSTNSQALTGTFTIPSVTVTTIVLTNNGTLTVGTALIGSGGLTQAASATLNIGGTSTITTLTATNTGNVVAFTGTSQTIPAVAYYNLNLSGSTTPVTLSGSYSIAGTYTPKSTTIPAQGTSTISFTGTSQTIPAFTYNNLTISGSTTPVLVNGGTITIAGAFTPGSVVPTVTGNTIAFTGTSQTIPAFTYNNLTISGSTTPVLVNGGTITIGGAFTPGSVVPTVTGNTIAFTGTSQTIPAFTYNNLTISGSTTPVLVNGGTITIGGAFTPGSVVPTVTGNTVSFNGGSPQNIPTFTFNNLTINNSSGVTLTGNATVGASGTLTLTSGNVTTGANTLIVSNSTVGAISRTSGQVVGNLQRAIATGSSLTYPYYVGTSASYDPVSILFASVTTGGNITAYVTSGQEPNNGSPVNTSNDVNLYWTLTNSGAVFTSYAPTFTYNTTDINGGGNNSGFIIGEYTSSAWTTPTPVTNGGSGPTWTTNVTGITGFGDFVAGSAFVTMAADYFRSIASGNWSTASTWQSSHDNSTWGLLATLAPTSSATLITLQSPNTLTVDVNNQTASSIVIASGSTLANSGSNALLVSGNWTSNGGTFTPASGTVTFNGSAAQNINGSAATQTFNSVTINGAGGVTVVGSTTTLNVGGNFNESTGNFAAPATMAVTGAVTLTAGTFTAGTNLSVGGNWTDNGGTFSAGSSTVTLNGSAAQSISGSASTQTFNNVTINNTSGVTFGGTSAFSIIGSLTIGNGKSLELLPAGSTLTIQSGASITTTGTGKIIIDTSASYINLSSSAPTLQVKRTIMGGGGWRMLADPDYATVGSMFASPFVTQGFSGATFDTLQPNLLWWDEADQGTSQQSWRQPSSSSDTVKPGRGYMYYVFNGAPKADMSGNYSDVLPLTMSALGAENPLTTAFNFGVTATPAGANDTSTSKTFTDIDSVNSGWNLVGNPTPSTIDWNASSGWTKTNMDASIYVWNPNDTVGGYKTWNGTTGNFGSGKIAPFQAFWVKANAASPQLKCTNGVKSTGGIFLGKIVAGVRYVGPRSGRFRREEKHEHCQVGISGRRCIWEKRHEHQCVGARYYIRSLGEPPSGASVSDVQPKRKADIRSLRCVQSGSPLDELSDTLLCCRRRPASDADPGSARYRLCTTLHAPIVRRRNGQQSATQRVIHTPVEI